MTNTYESTGRGNEVLENEHMMVSYNPAPFDTGQEETALLDKQRRNVWRILKGDFREDYAKLFPNFKDCLKFYNSKKKEFRSNFSTDDE